MELEIEEILFSHAFVGPYSAAENRILPHRLAVGYLTLNQRSAVRILVGHPNIKGSCGILAIDWHCIQKSQLDCFDCRQIPGSF